MAIQLMQGFRAERLNRLKSFPNGGTLRTGTYLIIKLPDPSICKLLARSFFLAIFIVSLPWIASTVRGFPETIENNVPNGRFVSSNLVNLEILPTLFRDLSNEGLLNSIKKSLIFSSNSEVLNGKDVEFVSVRDLERQNAIPNESFDFTFTDAFHVATPHEFIDRTLKIGGIVVIQLSKNPSFAFNKPSNYKVVYMRRFDKTVLAMKKTNYYMGESSASTQRKILSHTSEAKKVALKNLEDVLLEPPRAASGKSNRYLKRTKYLPDLMGDSLESYPRRVFIDVGLPEKEMGWFNKNYPTRNLHFDMYKIKTVPETTNEVTSSPRKDEFKAPMSEMGMSGWLNKNVKDEEYVVMKAEAEVVEEMVKSKAIDLVDELFLECKPQKKSKGSKRAYWECLALYGRLRDEGVAVHQWWG